MKLTVSCPPSVFVDDRQDVIISNPAAGQMQVFRNPRMPGSLFYFVVRCVHILPEVDRRVYENLVRTHCYGVEIVLVDFPAGNFVGRVVSDIGEFYRERILLYERLVDSGFLLVFDCERLCSLRDYKDSLDRDEASVYQDVISCSGLVEVRVIDDEALRSGVVGSPDRCRPVVCPGTGSEGFLCADVVEGYLSIHQTNMVVLFVNLLLSYNQVPLD